MNRENIVPISRPRPKSTRTYYLGVMLVDDERPSVYRGTGKPSNFRVEQFTSKTARDDARRRYRNADTVSFELAAADARKYL